MEVNAAITAEWQQKEQELREQQEQKEQQQQKRRAARTTSTAQGMCEASQAGGGHQLPHPAMVRKIKTNLPRLQLMV